MRKIVTRSQTLLLVAIVRWNFTNCIVNAEVKASIPISDSQEVTISHQCRSRTPLSTHTSNGVSRPNTFTCSHTTITRRRRVCARLRVCLCNNVSDSGGGAAVCRRLFDKAECCRRRRGMVSDVGSASLTPYTWAEKLESFEQINSIRETNENFDSCNSCKRLWTSRLHELHESKFRLLHVSNWFVRNFRIFLLVYTGSLFAGTALNPPRRLPCDSSWIIAWPC